MPYILAEHRRRLEGPLVYLIHRLGDNPAVGTINYIITKLLAWYWTLGPSYARINQIRGLLADIGHEFDRKVFDKYENAKCSENGEVFPEEE